MNDKQEWITARLAYLRGLKSPSDQQRLLIALSDKPARTTDDNRKLDVLVKAEKANERAQKARAVAAKVVNADKQADRKARDHELYNVAGLLSLAGLVDKVTGKPLTDRGELLGALLSLAKLPADEPRRAEWKKSGDALLAVAEKKGSNK